MRRRCDNAPIFYVLVRFCFFWCVCVRVCMCVYACLLGVHVCMCFRSLLCMCFRSHVCMRFRSLFEEEQGSGSARNGGLVLPAEAEAHAAHEHGGGDAARSPEAAADVTEEGGFAQGKF